MHQPEAVPPSNTAALTDAERTHVDQVYQSLSQRVDAGELTLTLPAGVVRLLLAERAERQQWQPIETAPQDWSWFLAWSADLGFLVYRMGPGLIAAEEPDPTHWMPLPSPPAVKETPAK